MRIKKTKKHVGEKSTSDEFGFVVPRSHAVFSIRPETTARQLFRITKKSDAQLRQIQIQKNELGAHWFPKPANGNWNTVNTLAGLLDYERSRAAKSQHIGTFTTMEQCEGFLHIPKPVQQFAKRKGCLAFKRNGNVDGNELALWLMSNVWEKLFSGDSAQLSSLGIEGFENIDGDYQQKRLSKARADEQERLNAEAEGQLHKQSDVWAIVYENGIQPIRDELARMVTLDSQCNPDHPDIARAAIKDWRDRVLKKCAACVPHKLAIPARTIAK
jgi:hypothetical protein